MKVWVNNRLDQEKVVDDNELVNEFLTTLNKDERFKGWPLRRALSVFLMEKNYSYDEPDFEHLYQQAHDSFNELIR